MANWTSNKDLLYWTERLIFGVGRREGSHDPTLLPNNLLIWHCVIKLYGFFSNKFADFTPTTINMSKFNGFTILCFCLKFISEIHHAGVKIDYSIYLCISRDKLRSIFDPVIISSGICSLYKSRLSIWLKIPQKSDPVVSNLWCQWHTHTHTNTHRFRFDVILN